MTALHPAIARLIAQDVRRMRFSSLLDRTEAKELTQEAASELLGINVRTFQRWAERFEAEGDDGLVDLRGAQKARNQLPENGYFATAIATGPASTG